jgi:uncharacterized protein DUF5658
MARTPAGHAVARLRAVLSTLWHPLLHGLTDRRLRLFMAAFVIGQVCDTVTTQAALSSGRFAEANPIFAPALVTHPGLAAVLKLGLALLVLSAALAKLAEPRRRLVLFALAFISLEAPASNALHMLGVL